MRVLLATAVACLALTACGQADPLPPGMASRITATGDVFSLAVPEGWSDVTDLSGNATATSGGVETHLLSVGPLAHRNLYVDVSWDTRGRGILLAGAFGLPVTIAGETLGGWKTAFGDVLIQFEHTLNGQRIWFNVTCTQDLASQVHPNSDQSDPCLGVIDSWRWETPSSSHVLPIAVGAGTVGALGGGLTLLAVRRRRHGSTPVELGDGP